MKRHLDLSPEAISERLRRASEMSDLDAQKRLDAKLDLSPEGISARLREASDLLDACVALAALGKGRR